MSYNRSRENHDKKSQNPKAQPCPYPEKCKPNCPGAIKDGNYCPFRNSCPTQTSTPLCKECLKAKEEFISRFTRSIHQIHKFLPCNPCRKLFEAEDSAPSTHMNGQTFSQCDAATMCSGPVVINAPDSCYPQTNLRIELHIHQSSPILDDIPRGVNSRAAVIPRSVSDANNTDTVVASRVMESAVEIKSSPSKSARSVSGTNNAFTVGSAKSFKSTTGTQASSIGNPEIGGETDNTFTFGLPASLKSASGTKAVGNSEIIGEIDNSVTVRSPRSLDSASGTKDSFVGNFANRSAC